MDEDEEQHVPGGFPRGAQYRDSCHEVTAVLAEVDDVAGPQTLAVIAIVSEDSEEEIKDGCRQYTRGSVFVETELSFPTRLVSLARNSTTRTKLAIIVSPKIDTLSLQVPSRFLRVSIAACEKERTILNLGIRQNIKEVILAEDSTYCDISLSKWNERIRFTAHELITGNGVVIDFPDNDMFNGPREPPPFPLERDNDVDHAARYIEREISTPTAASNVLHESGALPWMAGIGGTVAGLGAAGAILVSSIKVGIKGIYVATSPFGPIMAGSANLSGMLAAGASVGATGFAVGASVAAAIYFIPWRKLASWFMDAFSHFMGFLKSIWRKISDALSFLKKILLAILDLLRSLGSGVTGMAMRGVSSAARLFRGSGPQLNQRLHVS